MRLLYYYGEIVRFDKTMTDYVAINYSREYEFEHRMDKFFNRSNEILAVNVSFSERFLLSDFWSRNEKVYNCTVLVGENGTGKSTILQNIIANLLRIDRDFYSGESLMVFQDKGEIHAIARINDDIYYTRDNSLNRNNNPRVVLNLAKVDKSYKDDILSDLHNLLRSTNVAYISNAFSQNDQLDYVESYFNVFEEDKTRINSRLFNYSLTKRVTEIGKEAGEGFSLSDQMKVYWSIRYQDEARFVLSKKAKLMSSEFENNCNFGFKIPTSIRIKYADSLEDLLNESIVKTYNNSIKQLFDLINRMTIDSINVEKNGELDYRAAFYIAVYALLQSGAYIKISKNIKALNDNIKSLVNKYNDRSEPGIYIEDQKSILIEINDLIKKVIIDERNNDELSRYDEKYYKKALAGVEKVYELIDYLYANELMTKFSIVHSFDSETSELEANTDGLRDFCDEFTSFIDKYVATIKYLPRQYLSFSWGLSSGEDYILDMLASLNKMKPGNNGEPVQTIQIYLDEADMGLHPEWQRKWLYVFPQMVEELFEDTNVEDLQIVLATHSPLLLGDIPSKCANFIFSENNSITLKNNEKNEIVETFGQNLYTILRNGFFLRNGTLGEVAIKKSEIIADAFEIIRKLKKDLDDREGRTIKINDNSEEDEIAGDIKEIEYRNKKACEVLKNNLIELDKDENIKKIKCASGRTIKIGCGAYLYYIESLINLYSGFIKERLRKEFEKTVEIFIESEQTRKIKSIDKEIERLNKLKKEIEKS